MSTNDDITRTGTVSEMKRAAYNAPADTVTISKKEYESLKEDAAWLRALEAAGVDNWDGYDFARELLQED